jgi:hypothetical protein
MQNKKIFIALLFCSFGNFVFGMKRPLDNGEAMLTRGIVKFKNAFRLQDENLIAQIFRQRVSFYRQQVSDTAACAIKPGIDTDGHGKLDLERAILAPSEVFAVTESLVAWSQVRTDLDGQGKLGDLTVLDKAARDFAPCLSRNLQALRGNSDAQLSRCARICLQKVRELSLND